MADEMKELRGAVFDLIPDGVSVVALDEIEVDDMAPKTRNVKDEDSNKQHRVDDERFGGLVYKLPGVAVRDCRRKRIRDKVSVFVRQRPSAAIPEMTQLRLTGRVLLSPYAVDDLGFTIVADGVEREYRIPVASDPDAPTIATRLGVRFEAASGAEFRISGMELE